MSQNPAQNPYSAASPYTPTYIRGRNNTTTLPIRYEGELVAPDSGTYALYGPGGELVASNSVVVVDDVATFSIGSADLGDDAELSAAYQEVWELTFGDRVQAFDREIVVARRALHPVVSDDDLLGVYSGLRRDLPQGVTSFQHWITEAWKQVLGWLIGRNIYPHRIMSHEALRTWHTRLALSLFFGECARLQPSRGNYVALAEKEEKAAAAARDQLTAHMDNDEDGKVDDVHTRQAAARIVHLNAAPAGAGSYRGGRF